MQADSPRYLQESDAKTLKALNFLSLENMTTGGDYSNLSTRRRANLNITINNNNTSLVMSPVLASTSKLNQHV